MAAGTLSSVNNQQAMQVQMETLTEYVAACCQYKPNQTRLQHT